MTKQVLPLQQLVALMPGSSSEAVAGATVAQAALGWLPQVIDIARRYRRVLP